MAQRIEKTWRQLNSQYLKMEHRFKKRKKPNYKRGVVLAILLLVIIYLWFNAERIIDAFFGVQS